MNDPYLCKCSMLNYPLLLVSRMVRPAGRGRGANDPPLPEFFAGMMQQFEMNRQFMEGMMAQFPRSDMNQQPALVTLQDFMCLNPTIYRSSTQPLNADIGSATSHTKWSLLVLPLPAMSPSHLSF